ncbi:MAG TPA: class I SAM-dependent methyltransferase [Leptolyngbyaceae cyanobacterium]
MTHYTYVGSELELFRYASNWKSYYSSIIQPYLADEVLEVGAGIGSTTQVICQGKQKRWVCLEPDVVLADQLKTLIFNQQLPKCCELKTGTLTDLSNSDTYDTIIYIDVLEHIKDDTEELKSAIKHLKKDGVLIVLSPAHQWLFTPFDKAIGHYRRYNKNTLSKVIPDDLKCQRMIYLDSVGVIASMANRFLLKSKMPTIKQIKLWDRKMVPLSQKIDPLIQYSIGKTIIGIWQKT